MQLQVTGFGYEHDEPWAANIELFKYFTDKTQGVRRLGAAAIDLCHVALGDLLDLYPQRPWYSCQAFKCVLRSCCILDDDKGLFL